MKRIVAGYLTLFLHGLWLLTAAGTCGCASTPAVQPSVIVTQSAVDPELEILRDGMAAFSNGDYNDASVRFETLIGQTQNQLILRRALFALACSKLAQAESCNDVAEAMVVWNRWKKLRPMDDDDREDPSMLSPFLTQINSWKTPTAPVYIPRVAASNKLESCREALDKRQKEVQQLKSKLDSRQRETAELQARIKKLKEQINSLEAIYREIQQKKKEVSSQ